VVPHVRDHGLPEEDAVPRNAHEPPQVVVIACPHASNLDEFESLRRAGVRVAFATDRTTVANARWLVLPGSKHTLADLAWLRSTGLDEAVRAHARAGLPLLGICGGMQLLGERIEDPQGIEGGLPASEPGLALLPLRTRFEADKLLVKTRARFGMLHGAWAALTGVEADGYEIRLGRTTPGQGEFRDEDEGNIDSVLRRIGDATPIGWQQQSVLGVYLHGLFENPAVVAALFGVTPQPLEAVFDRLADTLDDAFAPGVLDALADPGR
jgi:adenosylcobyric acid synthase